ncbi:MAG: hypothetical protein AAGD11_06310 [Planctomycetota bacterium]
MLHHGTREAARQTAKQTGRHLVVQASKHSAAHAARHTAIHGLRNTGRIAAHGTAKATKYADDLAKVAAKTSAQSQRRLSMLADTMNQHGYTADVVAALASAAHPDLLVSKLWTNRGKITAGISVVGLMMSDKLSQAAMDHIAKPLLNSLMTNYVLPIAKLASVVAIAFVCLKWFLLGWLKWLAIRPTVAVLGYANRRFRRDRRQS